MLCNLAGLITGGCLALPRWACVGSLWTCMTILTNFSLCRLKPDHKSWYGLKFLTSQQNIISLSQVRFFYQSSGKSIRSNSFLWFAFKDGHWSISIVQRVYVLDLTILSIKLVGVNWIKWNRGQIFWVLFVGKVPHWVTFHVDGIFLIHRTSKK